MGLKMNIEGELKKAINELKDKIIQHKLGHVLDFFNKLGNDNCLDTFCLETTHSIIAEVVTKVRDNGKDHYSPLEVLEYLRDATAKQTQELDETIQKFKSTH
jgi:hypothetical protein